MKISVDGGGLCTEKGFGNYIFTVNILRALSLFDSANSYSVYTFCDVPGFAEMYSQLTQKKLLPVRGWMKVRVSAEELAHKQDIFLALNQSLPIFSRSRFITFSHGLSFYLFPKLYKDAYNRLKSQLYDYSYRSEKIVVTSERVKKDLVTFNSSIKNKISVLPCGIPYDFHVLKPMKREKFFLFVGGNQKIKNIQFIVDMFEKFTSYEYFKNYKLYLVSHCKEFHSENIEVIPVISRPELLTLYRKATAYLSASYYESFNFPILEALSQKCPVLTLESAVIPEMKEYVYAAQNDKMFLEFMRRVAKGNVKKYSISSLHKRFSWEDYVSKLRSLYN